MKTPVLFSLLLLVFFSCKDTNQKTSEAQLEKTTTPENTIEAIETSIAITPISHATMVLQWNENVIYVDPVGGAEAFEGQPSPDVILVTDIHGDHFNEETLEAVITEKTVIIVPKAVMEKMNPSLQSQTSILNNGTSTELKMMLGVKFHAVPMYNLREEALKFHPQGRGNGYVIDDGNKRVYISGDTEDIPEMRSLENIDIAFVCMNLPYTMTVQSAASAVVAFKPKKVYPYHYRGAEGMSDVGVFRDLIKKSSVSNQIEVVQLDWYPEQ
ncbi:MBL fold metallo-hydrolase [Marinirhabdus gelatinilytica]|uniref:L-ascorbate metabolism protein UlaG (Beta-lactamase superfamily) n=1 Tax=Marinirhabdus gelatinilytica TaxID=1703343 RepID=A0A370QFF1_9FLAO|nr:MBL fold metallo-hydrolase [Marinirhabdus gelatinilytica]RDK87098.1 L-ascorbate metabolism protein UlaG (beta-lactamase superfamily) [Marinirhabdus gelatinilytica]